MTDDEREIRRKLAVLKRAEELGSAAKAYRYFGIPKSTFFRWQRLIKRTGIVDLRFHDLRHEAISRFFEMGLSVPEVALISGHRDYRMLQRYTHLKAKDVAFKLK